MVDEINVDFYAQQIVPSQELKKYVLLNSTGYLARLQASSGNTESTNWHAKIFEKMMSRLEYEISKRKALQLYLS